MTRSAWDGMRRFRGLWRQKSWVAMIVLPLALGIGVTIAVFTIAQDVLLAPLRFPAPEQLVSLQHSIPGEEGTLRLSPANYLDLEAASPSSFASLAAYEPIAATLIGQGDPLNLDAVRVSPSFFDVVAVMPQIGRPFDRTMARLPETEGIILDHGSTVILSHRLWKSRFGGDESVVGAVVTLDARRLEVVGVMPRDFDFPAGADLYLPLGFGEVAPHDRGGYYLEAIARLAEGRRLEQARVESEALMAGLRQAAPRINEKLDLSVLSLRDRLVEDLELGIWLLFGVSSLILLLVSANSAQLFWARGLERQRDLAIHLALGASRGSLIRQFLAESLGLATLATVLGSLLAWFGLDALVAVIPEGLFAGRPVELDAGSLPFIVALGLLVGLAVGLAPILALTRLRSLPRRLAEGGRSQSLGRGQKAIQDVMVIAQLALAMMLLHTTYLMLASYVELRSVPLGFDPEGVVTLDTTLPWEGYEDEATMRLFAERAVAEIASRPGVRSAGLGLRLPVVDGAGGVWVRTDPSETEAAHPSTFHTVDSGFLPTLGVGLVRGRNIDPGDRSGTAPVAVVNQTFVRHHFAGLDPLEQTITLTPWPELQFQIVGIAQDVPQGGVGRQMAPAVYVPYAQVPMERLRLVARVDGDPERAVPTLAAAVWDVDPTLGFRVSATLNARLEKVLLPARISTTLIGFYGVFGALLAATGVFGVIAFFVESRRSEISIRLALGSQPRSLLVWVFRKALARTAVGLGLGVLGAVVLAIAMTEQLFGGISWSLPSLLLSLCGLATVVALAQFFPARRAIRVAPTASLLRG